MYAGVLAAEVFGAVVLMPAHQARAQDVFRMTKPAAFCVAAEINTTLSEVLPGSKPKALILPPAPGSIYYRVAAKARERRGLRFGALVDFGPQELDIIAGYQIPKTKDRAHFEITYDSYENPKVNIEPDTEQNTKDMLEAGFSATRVYLDSLRAYNECMELTADIRDL